MCGGLHRQHELLVRPSCQARVPSGLRPESVTFVLLHQMQIDRQVLCVGFFFFFFIVFVFLWEGVRFASILQKGGGGSLY